MSGQNKQVALQFMEAMGTSDPETAARLLDPEVVAVAKGFSKLAGTRGYDAIVGAIAGFQRVMPSGLRPKIHEVVAEGDHVVVEWEGDAVTSEGGRYCNQYCMVFTLKDGRITRIHEYFCGLHTNEVLWPVVEKMLDAIPAG